MSDEHEDRKVRCRYLRRSGEQCTGEVLDASEGALIYVCAKHAGRIMQMITEQQEATQ